MSKMELALLLLVMPMAVLSKPSKCSGRNDGSFRNQTNCHKYYTCVGGNLVGEFTCPDNLFYDEQNGRCDRNTFINCPAEPKPNGFCGGLDDGDYKYEPDCSKYISCVAGTEYIRNCSSSEEVVLHFNEIKNKCLRPEEAGCQ